MKSRGLMCANPHNPHFARQCPPPGLRAAEIAGTIGGAVVGNESEKRVKRARRFDVTARFQGGGTRTISYATEPVFKVGDKVRLVNGTLLPDS